MQERETSSSSRVLQSDWVEYSGPFPVSYGICPRFGPSGAPSLGSGRWRGLHERCESGKRAAEMGSIAAGDPCFCSQPGWKRQGIPRVCHRPERECGRNAGSDTARSARHSPAPARDPKRPGGRVGSSAASFPCAACQGAPQHACRRVLSARSEIRTSAAPIEQPQCPAAENCFCSVKTFAHGLAGSVTLYPIVALLGCGRLVLS